MNKKNQKDFLGFIKFVDYQYIHDLFNLDSLWLSNYRFFIGNKETSEEDLINDEYEGRLDKLQTNMPAFLTCFTLIEKDSFDETGTLKDDISSALINSEKCMNKNRSFVYIPKENMECLIKNKLSEINKINKYSNYPKSDIFTRFIHYKRDYKDYMEKKEQELRTAKPDIGVLENIGMDMFCTKPDRFEVQNEFRIGKVLPVNEEDSQYKNKNGISIPLGSPIPFATKKFSQSNLKNLSKIDLQNLNKENLNKEKKNEEGFKK